MLLLGFNSLIIIQTLQADAGPHSFFEVLFGEDIPRRPLDEDCRYIYNGAKVVVERRQQRDSMTNIVRMTENKEDNGNWEDRLSGISTILECFEHYFQPHLKFLEPIP